MTNLKFHLTEEKIYDIEIDDLLKLEPKNLRKEVLELVFQYYGVDYLLEKIKIWLKDQKERNLQTKMDSSRQDMLSSL